MQVLTTTVARILFAIPFIVFGLLHLMSGQQMAGMVPSFVPGGVFWIYFTGLCLIAAGVSIIIKKMGKLACLLLSTLLAIFILTIHLPGLGGEMMQMSMMGLLKDLGLIGGALTWAGLFEKEEGRL